SRSAVEGSPDLGKTFPRDSISRAQAMASDKPDSSQRALFRAASLVSLVLIWQCAAAIAHSSLLPGPAPVVAFGFEEASVGDLLRQLGITVLRVAASFAGAMLIGCAIGIALGRDKRLNLWFDGWLVVFLNMPALVVAVLAYAWLGLTEVAAITAVAINKIP